MCIDESIIPFVGRLSFRQYIKNHRYGIKIFKLCIQDAYTIGFRVYTGRESEPEFELTNRKHNPQDVVKHKLKKGEIVAQKSNTGILILKWKDKRDVLMLSTKHEDNIRQIQTKIETEVGKPEVVLDYNRGKSLVDVSDLRSSYHTPLRRSMKWYRKVAFEVLLNTSVINALILYNKVNNCNMSVTEFRESIIFSMIDKPVDTEIDNIEMHSIVEKTTSNRCAISYQKLVLKEGGRAYAQSKTKK
ncbi:piggyBac transposable element-derived protein 4-like, partial [Acyrthosiphon pisum]|uniref:PiggyBac transposable element-derived protein domain-containing protein n=1 Tax=Acyrthosiphon pisum TaxID=7029 RepID=A0A8R2NU15_ACYPI